jgi:hypothetical protein
MIKPLRVWLGAALIGGAVFQGGCGPFPYLQRELDLLFSPMAYDSLLFVPLSRLFELLGGILPRFS